MTEMTWLDLIEKIVSAVEQANDNSLYRVDRDETVLYGKDWGEVTMLVRRLGRSLNLVIE